MKNPRIKLEEHSNTTHKLLGIANDLKNEDARHNSEVDKIIVKLALLKQELMDNVEWENNENGEETDKTTWSC